MSRPTKTDSAKLSAVLPPIRCTEDEKKLIRQHAKTTGLSMSEYVRQMALHGQIIVKQSALNMDALHQLRKLGVNLNQQTKKLNTTGVMPAELKKLWGKLENVLDHMMKQE